VVHNEKDMDRAITEYREFLESVWSEEAMFMNYLEGMQFASACADVVASTRDEYIAAFEILKRNSMYELQNCLASSLYLYSLLGGNNQRLGAFNLW
jgi:hypothetical protein